MIKLRLKPVGWAVSIVYVLIEAAALLHQAILGNSELGAYHNQLLQVLNPGYQELNLLGIVIVLVEAFVYAWIGSAVFVAVYNHFNK
ncbi:MAG: hypothetical protein ABIG32_03500 [Candidatus Uhrbacteria bacterium]|nr:hypothetical protein [Patescibacteria group bacterium]MBU1907394.1 hypothetical protein [Patescibacteria group bacterium]